MDIREGHLDSPAVIALLHEHLDALARLTPSESMHALDIGRLRQPDVTFWAAWEGAAVLGCAALRHLGPSQGELKSMRTARAHLRRGVAAALLAHAIAEARRRGYARLSLETGSSPAFAPAHRLYARAGFRPCGPFGPYVEDPHSRFMALDLAGPAIA